MSREIISFNTAKLAQQKAFDLAVLDCYNSNEEVGDNELNILMNYNKFPTDNRSHLNMYSAPTQTQLQKWLREKHEIHIVVKRKTVGSDEWEYSYEINYLPKDCWELKRRSSSFIYVASFGATSSTYIGAWRTYEKALEQALLHGLKLIP